MQVQQANGVALHWREDGAPEGAPVVFANSLGTDLRLWDDLLPHLPAGLRVIRYDKRGHGLSETPKGPYALDDLVDDAAALLDGLGIRGAVFVGLSIGGLIGIGLAARRPDLVRALVVSNAAVTMGTPQMWADRISAIEAGGIEAMSEAILDRWFGPSFRQAAPVPAWKAMMERTPREGYLGCCAAIAAADLAEAARALTLPALTIAGEHDGACPVDQVRNTAMLLDAADHMIPGTGHLPCVEAPGAYAAILTPFLEEHAHV